jgi:hypothetical protein
MEEPMQLTPLTPLVRQCDAATRQLERLQEKKPARRLPQPLFAQGLNSDLQRVSAVELILMHLERRTRVVQVEMAEAIGNLLETIGATYRDKAMYVLRKGHPGTARSARDGLRN